MIPPLKPLEALYIAKQYGPCLQRTQSAIAAGATEGVYFTLAAACLARLGRRRELVAIVHSAGEKSARLMVWTCLRLLEEQAYTALALLEEQFSGDDPGQLIAAYYSGCALMMMGRHGEAMARFKLFRLGWPRFADTIDFANGKEFNVLFRQGRLVADAEEVVRRRGLATRMPALDFIGEPDPGRPVVFASGNSLYFNAMAPVFVDGVLPYLAPLPDGREMGLHLHVIGPDAESLALIESLRALHGARIAFSLEKEPLFSTVTYYSCSRFYVMTAVLDRYRAPVLSFDIDIVPTRPLAPLFDAGDGYDFCCFRTTRNEPASVYQASVMYWPDRAATRTFLDDLQHFAWEEARNPSRTSWMLDQAGLFSLLADPAAAIKFGDYRALTGRPLEEHVRIMFDDQVKARLRMPVIDREPDHIVLSPGQRKR